MKIPDWLMPEPYFKRALFFISLGFIITISGFVIALAYSLSGFDESANFLVMELVIGFGIFQLIAVGNIVVGLFQQVKKEWKNG